MKPHEGAKKQRGQLHKGTSTAARRPTDPCPEFCCRLAPDTSLLNKRVNSARFSIPLVVFFWFQLAKSFPSRGDGKERERGGMLDARSPETLGEKKKKEYK